MKAKIEQLVAEELARANEKFPAFSSHHEAYAVLLEEVEELAEVLNTAKPWMNKTWEEVRGKHPDKEHNIRCFLVGIKHIATESATEAIQVAAMCDKWMQFLEKENGRGQREPCKPKPHRSPPNRYRVPTPARLPRLVVRWSAWVFGHAGV